jgi:hypothetical protein
MTTFPRVGAGAVIGAGALEGTVVVVVLVLGTDTVVSVDGTVTVWPLVAGTVSVRTPRESADTGRRAFTERLTLPSSLEPDNMNMNRKTTINANTPTGTHAHIGMVSRLRLTGGIMTAFSSTTVVAAIGKPQFGHATASSETSWLHSGQSTSDILLVLLLRCVGELDYRSFCFRRMSCSLQGCLTRFLRLLSSGSKSVILIILVYGGNEWLKKVWR